jgi:hypothetical protein
MATDSDMKINYAEVLRQLERDLDGIDERRRALQASIAAMRRLVYDDDSVSPPSSFVIKFHDPGARRDMPSIPPKHFSKMTPTEAYRELMRLWPQRYTPPEIADLFQAGGMTHKKRTDLLQAIHSILKRERDKLAKLNAQASAVELPAMTAEQRKEVVKDAQTTLREMLRK